MCEHAPKKAKTEPSAEPEVSQRMVFTEYWPTDRDPSECFPFPNLKVSLRGHRFPPKEEVIAYVCKCNPQKVIFLSEIPTSTIFVRL